MSEEKDHRDEFEGAVHLVNVPTLALDQKWHRLFALSGKPQEIVDMEAELDDLLQQQGKIREEISGLKRRKQKIMNSVVVNMDGAEDGNASRTARLDEDKNDIESINARMDELEDELLELPGKIKVLNNQLMVETMDFCYNRMRVNTAEAKEIGAWIANVRVELKKNIIRKQNRDINNRQMYNYMHDIFGPSIMDIFDLVSEEIDMDALTAPPKSAQPAPPKSAPADTKGDAKLPDGSVKKLSGDDKAGVTEKKENFGD